MSRLERQPADVPVPVRVKEESPGPDPAQEEVEIVDEDSSEEESGDGEDQEDNSHDAEMGVPVSPDPSGRGDAVANIQKEYRNIQSQVVRAYRSALSDHDLDAVQGHVDLMRDAALQMNPDACRAIAKAKVPIEAENSSNKQRVHARRLSQLMWEETKIRSILNKEHSKALRSRDLNGLARDVDLWKNFKVELDPKGERCKKFLASKSKLRLNPLHKAVKTGPKQERWREELFWMISEEFHQQKNWTPAFLSRIENSIELLKDRIRAAGLKDMNRKSKEGQGPATDRQKKKLLRGGKQLNVYNVSLVDLQSKAEQVMQYLKRNTHGARFLPPESQSSEDVSVIQELPLPLPRRPIQVWESGQPPAPAPRSYSPRPAPDPWQEPLRPSRSFRRQEDQNPGPGPGPVSLLGRPPASVWEAPAPAPAPGRYNDFRQLPPSDYGRAASGFRGGGGGGPVRWDRDRDSRSRPSPYYRQQQQQQQQPQQHQQQLLLRDRDAFPSQYGSPQPQRPTWQDRRAPGTGTSRQWYSPNQQWGHERR